MKEVDVSDVFFNVNGMKNLMEATSVAIVGASTDPTKIGGRPIAYMLKNGFQGKIFPINPNHAQVQGMQSYPKLEDVPEQIDLAIIVTPSFIVQDIVKEGIKKGIKSFVVFSSGFAESGPEGVKRQQELIRLVKEHKVNILGPNCLGAVNASTGLIASFTTAMEEGELQKGGFSLASQSGALGAYWIDLCLRAGIGYSKWITTGSECDLDASDGIFYLVSDPETRVIGVYIEDVQDTVKFRLALQQAAEKGKPVLIIKSGRSELGAKAAASHTGALSGDDVLYDACIEQFGALRVDSLGEMIDIARVFLYDSVPHRGSLAVMSVSGGAAVLIADEAQKQSLTLQPFQETTTEQLTEVLPDYVSVANPLDLTGNVVQNTQSIQQTLSAVSAESTNDVIVLFVGLMHSIADAFIDAIVQAKEKEGKPIVVIWVGAKRHAINKLIAKGIVVFEDIPQALSALGSTVRLLKVQEQAKKRAVLLEKIQPVAHQKESRKIRPLAEWQGKTLLSKLGVNGVAKNWLITSEQQIDGLDEVDYPVVAKLQADSLVHKSDIGGVILNIKDKEQLRTATKQLLSIAQKNNVDIIGVLVEPMAKIDHELLVGLRRDEHFGMTLTLGRGGVAVELDPDFVTGLLPLSADQIKSMLLSLRNARIFQGFRNQSPVPIDEVVEFIEKLCQIFAKDEALAEIEINPLAIAGKQIQILDAVVSQYE